MEMPARKAKNRSATAAPEVAGVTEAAGGAAELTAGTDAAQATAWEAAEGAVDAARG
jgi:hypothetical protein